MDDDFFGALMTDELGGADEALALASYAAGTAGGSAVGGADGGVGRNVGNPLLKRSRNYFTQRTPGQLVGLDNQGATCYLNSLLQSLYLTPEFRQLLYDLPESALGLQAYQEHEAREAEEKEAWERMSAEEKAAHKAAQAVEISEERVAEFVAMGMERLNVVRTLRKFPAPSQQDAAMEYLFSHDFSSDPQEPEPKPRVRPYKRVPIEFRRFFASLQLGAQATLGTEGITKSFGWDAREGQAGVQHDIQELYIRLMEALSGSLTGLEGEKRMAALYRGAMTTRTTCSECGLLSARNESMYNFNVHVKGIKHLRDSLAQLVTPELMEGSNAYRCAACNKKVRAWRQDCIATLPPLLTLALNRHEYNKKNWQRVKINDRLPFPLVIDMQPYTEQHAAKSRSQLEEDDRRAKEGQAAGQGQAAASSSAASGAQQASDLDIAIANSLKTPEQLKQEEASAAAASAEAGKGDKGGKQPPQQQQGKKAKKGQKEAVEEDAEVGLEPSVFDPASPLLYDLFAVVVHAGGAHGGHYYAYVLDVVAQNNYFDAHPDAREQWDAFVRDPSSASAAAAPGHKAAGYSADATKSAHPSFWSELNDSNVSSNISLSKIASKYGGRQSAYILMYRHRGLNAAKAPSSTGAGAQEVVDIVRGEGPRVPASLAERVERFNAQLAEERAVYDVITNEIEVELHDEREFAVHGGQLYPRDYDPVAEELKQRAKDELQHAKDDPLEGLAGMLFDEPEAVAPAGVAAAPPRRIVVDQRITVPELHAKVRATLEAEAAAALAQGDEASSRALLQLADKFVLNQLALKARPPHQVEGYLSLDDPLDGAGLPGAPGAPGAAAGAATAASDGAGGGTGKKGKKKKSKPNPKTLEQLGFSSLQPVLVWDGKSIQGVPFTTGTKRDQVVHLHCVLFGAEAVAKAQQAVAAAAAEAAADGEDDGASAGVLTLSPTPGAPLSERAEFFLPVAPLSNLANLVSLLSERLGLLPADQVSLLCMHPVSKVIKTLPAAAAGDEALKPLKYLGVVNHSWIGIELASAAAAGGAKGAGAVEKPSLARAYFEELEQAVRLVVLNTLPPESGSVGPDAVAPPQQFELDCIKSSSVLELKTQVLSQLLPSHPSLTLEQFRLRKVVGLDRPGALLVDEALTLARADLAEDEMRVRAEMGTLPDTKTHLDVLVTLVANITADDAAAGSSSSTAAAAAESAKAMGLTKLVDRVPFVADLSWTIKQAKAAMLTYFGLSHRPESSFALYRGHATSNEPAKPFTAEFITLACMKLEQSTWLWLEEGEVPQSAGMVQIEVVQLLVQGEKNHPLTLTASSPPEAVAAAAEAAEAASSSAASSSPMSDVILSVADWRAMQEPLSPYVAPVPSSADGASSASSSNGSSDVSLVLVSPCPRFHLCPLFTMPFSSNDTLLELKHALYSYPNSPLGAAASAAHLRVRMCTRGDGVGKWLNGDEKTLKKQGINVSKRLLVQMLPENMPERNASQGALLLKLCTAVPSSAPEGGVRVGPAALQEFLFDDGEYPQLPALQRTVAALAGVAPGEKIGVLKWIGKEKEKDDDDADKDGAAAKTPSSAPAAAATQADGAASASLQAPAAAASSALSGWIVLCPDGPDPAVAAATPATSTVAPGANGVKGTQGGAKGKGQGQQQKGGKGEKQQSQKGGGKGGKGSQAVQTPAVPVPAWHLKSGPHPLREDDVLLVVRLSDFGLASLGELSTLARSWGLAGALPPGYALVEKDRADELERTWERARKAAPKQKEIELKIEY